jgi:hypothetical protein
MGQEPPQPEIVRARARRVDQIHVGEVPVGVVVNSGAPLMRRCA